MIEVVAAIAGASISVAAMYDWLKTQPDYTDSVDC